MVDAYVNQRSTGGDDSPPIGNKKAPPWTPGKIISFPRRLRRRVGSTIGEWAHWLGTYRIEKDNDNPNFVFIYYHHAAVVKRNGICLDEIAGQLDSRPEDIEVLSSRTIDQVQKDLTACGRPFYATHEQSPFSLEEIEARVEQFKNWWVTSRARYRLIKMNCQHFAYWCVYNRCESPEIQELLNEVTSGPGVRMVRGGAAVLAGAMVGASTAHTKEDTLPSAFVTAGTAAVVSQLQVPAWLVVLLIILCIVLIWLVHRCKIKDTRVKGVLTSLSAGAAVGLMCSHQPAQQVVKEGAIWYSGKNGM